MKDIKFRAWIKEENKMVDVVDLDLERGLMIYKEKCHLTNACFENIDLMQFTGLYDKNNTPIYEGDIVETVGHNSAKTLEIVKYSEGCFNVGYHCGSSTKRSPMLLHSKKIKVLGNIYENGDLL